MSLIPAGVIDHVGIAVHDLDAAAERYQQLMGAELIGREAIAAQWGRGRVPGVAGQRSRRVDSAA